MEEKKHCWKVSVRIGRDLKKEMLVDAADILDAIEFVLEHCDVEINEIYHVCLWSRSVGL